MSAYQPPIEDLAIFDSSVFLNGDEPLTYNQAVKKFLKYPNAQGTENLLTTNVNGILTANDEVFFNDRLRLSSATTIVWEPTDYNYLINRALVKSGTGHDNICIGATSLESLTTGSNNCCVGTDAGQAIDTGSRNCIFGDLAGQTLQSGSGNCIYGSSGLRILVAGDQNVVVGTDAGTNTTASNRSITIGYLANNQVTDTTYDDSVAIGSSASNNNFSNSVAIGTNSLNTSANQVRLGTATETVSCPGDVSLGGDLILAPATQIQWDPTNRNYMINEDLPKSLTTGSDNVAMGKSAINVVTSGGGNIGLSTNAGSNITTGSENICLGKNSGLGIELNNLNIAIGTDAISTYVAGSNIRYNIGIGYQALKAVTTNITSGLENVAIGYNSGISVTTGQRNTFIGSSTGATTTTAGETTAIGYNADCGNFLSSTAIGSGAVCTANNQIRLGKSNQTVSCPGTLTFKMASDNNNGTYYIPFSKVAGGTESALFVDDVTGPLSYNPSTATLSCTYTALFQGIVNTNNTSKNYFWTDRTTRPTGGNNVAIGYNAANGLSSGTESIFLGTEAGKSASSGSQNVYIGHQTSTNSNASNCITIGYRANQNNVHGNNCVAIGNTASCSTFNTCVALGSGATNTSNNQIRLGTSAQTVSCPGPTTMDGVLSTSITSAPSSARHLGYTVNQSTAGWTVSIPSNTQTNITSVSFTSADYGTYLFEAKIQINPADNSVARQQIIGVSTVSGSYSNNTDLQYTIATVGYPMLKVMRVLNIYANTTVYLVGYVLGTSGTVITSGSLGIFSYTRIA
jgi:hypothetical protein